MVVQSNLASVKCFLVIFSYLAIMLSVISPSGMNVFMGRLKSIMLLNSPIILSGNSFKFTYYSQNYSHILTIIPTKSSLFSTTHANILINTNNYI